MYIEGGEDGNSEEETIKGAFNVGDKGIMDSEAEEVVAYGNIEPIDDWKCGVKTKDVVLPTAAAEAEKDLNACISFDA